MMISDKFTSQLEDLLELYTTYHAHPRQDDMIVREWYVCDVCENKNEEAVVIKHEEWCIAGRVQEALLDD